MCRIEFWIYLVVVKQHWQFSLKGGVRIKRKLINDPRNRIDIILTSPVARLSYLLSFAAYKWLWHFWVCQMPLSPSAHCSSTAWPSTLLQDSGGQKMEPWRVPGNKESKSSNHSVTIILKKANLLGQKYSSCHCWLFFIKETGSRTVNSTLATLLIESLIHNVFVTNAIGNLNPEVCTFNNLLVLAAVILASRQVPLTITGNKTSLTLLLSRYLIQELLQTNRCSALFAFKRSCRQTIP